MLWLPIILLLGPHCGIATDRGHDNWRKSDQIRILADETDKQDGTEAIGKHENWQEMNQATNQLHETDQKSGIEVVEEPTSQEIYSINTRTLLDITDLQIVQHDGSHETFQETDSIGILADKTERERTDIPDGTIQTLKGRGLSLRRLSLGKCLTGKRDRRRSPEGAKGLYTESRCEKCCRVYDNPATTELVEADANVDAVPGTEHHPQGQEIERPNRRLKERHTHTSKDGGAAALFIILAALVCCGCLCDKKKKGKRG